MDLSPELAQERWLEIKKSLGRNYVFPRHLIPISEKPWTVDTDSLIMRVTSSFVRPDHFYINFVLNLPGYKGHSCLFNIRRFGETLQDRIEIYHDGDNSTLKRAGTYHPLVKFILMHFPQLRSSQYPSFVRLGSIPRTGEISISDLEKDLLPGLGMHALARWIYFSSKTSSKG